MMWPQYGQEKNTARLNLEDICLILRGRRLRWFGYMERSNGAIITACNIYMLTAGRGQGAVKGDVEETDGEPGA